MTQSGYVYRELNNSPSPDSSKNKCWLTPPNYRSIDGGSVALRKSFKPETGILSSYRDSIGLVTGLQSVMYGESVLIKSEGFGHQRFASCTALAYNLRLEGLRALVQSRPHLGRAQLGLDVPRCAQEIVASWVNPETSTSFFALISLRATQDWLIQYLHQLSKRCVFEAGIIFIIGNTLTLQPGSKVFASNHLLRFPCGMELLGKTLNVLGEPLDGLETLYPTRYMLVEAEAPSIINRSNVCEPLKTGVLAVDSLVPAGRGQRQLIIGDRQSGKTSLALESVITQARLKHLYLMSSLLQLEQTQFIDSVLDSTELQSWVGISCIYDESYSLLDTFLYRQECPNCIPFELDHSFSILLNLPVNRLDLEMFFLSQLHVKKLVSRAWSEQALQTIQVNPMVSPLTGLTRRWQTPLNFSPDTPVISFLSLVSLVPEAPHFFHLSGADYENNSAIFLKKPALIYSSAIYRFDCSFDSSCCGLLQFYLPDLISLVTLVLGLNLLSYNPHTQCVGSSPTGLKLIFDFGYPSIIYPSKRIDDFNFLNVENNLFDITKTRNKLNLIVPRQNALAYISPISRRVVSRSGLLHGNIPGVVVGLTPSMKDMLVLLFSTIALIAPGSGLKSPHSKRKEDSSGEGFIQSLYIYKSMRALSSLCPITWSSNSQMTLSILVFSPLVRNLYPYRKLKVSRTSWASPWDSISFLEQSLRRFLNYSAKKEKGSFCVYVSVGQKASFIATLIQSLKSCKFPDLHLGDLGLLMSGGGLNLILKYHPLVYPPNATELNRYLSRSYPGFINLTNLAEPLWISLIIFPDPDEQPKTEESLKLLGHLQNMNSIPIATAYDYTVLISAFSNSLAASQYLAPYSGVAYAEYFVEQGHNVLVVFDDLTKQAVAYRQIALSFYRPPGREAFPGDIFFVHSRLLERVAKTRVASITAFPIVETQAGDVSSFIPTNVISITDGQIRLSKYLHGAGQIPGLDIGFSVSRVGSIAQNFLMKNYTSSLKLVLAQYKEVISFSRFQEDVSNDVHKSLNLGLTLLELLKHDKLKSLCEFYEVMLLFLALSPNSLLVSTPKNFILSRKILLTGGFLSGLRKHNFDFLVGQSFFMQSSTNNGCEKVFIQNDRLRFFLLNKLRSAIYYRQPCEGFKRYAEVLSLCRFVVEPGFSLFSLRGSGIASYPNIEILNPNRGFAGLNSPKVLPFSLNYNNQKSPLLSYFHPSGLNDIFTVCKSGHFSIAYQSANILTKLISKRFWQLLITEKAGYQHPAYDPTNEVLNFMYFDPEIYEVNNEFGGISDVTELVLKIQACLSFSEDAGDDNIIPNGLNVSQLLFVVKYWEIKDLLCDLIEPTEFSLTGESLYSMTFEDYINITDSVVFPSDPDFFINHERYLAFQFLEIFSNLFFLDYALTFSASTRTLLW